MTGKSEPEISVGIVTGSGLTFTLNGDFLAGDSGKMLSGMYTAVAGADGLLLQGGAGPSGPGMRSPSHRRTSGFAASPFMP